jgi:hypothetical protein
MRFPLKMTVRLSENEKLLWSKNAEALGIGIADFIRLQVNKNESGLTRIQTPRKRPKLLKPNNVDPKLLFHLSQIGNNLNQLARVANAEKQINADALMTLKKLQSQISELLP